MHGRFRSPSYLTAPCSGARHASTPSSITGRAYPALKGRGLRPRPLATDPVTVGER